MITLLMSTLLMADENGIDMMNDTLNKIMEKDNIPGLQYTVLNDAGVVFEYSGGFQNIANKTPVTENTSFMLNSSTKVFTAAAILQLIDRGKINLDHSLSDYYPDHPYGEEVTIRHLLNQTSGIPNPLPLQWLHLTNDHKKFDEEASLAKVLADEAALSFPPGEKYAYSNISYWLLGMVIEKVSGRSYCEYMRQFIFDPLAISANELDCNMQGDKLLATGYQKKYSFLSLFFYFAGVSEFFGDSEDGFLSFKRVYHNGPSYGGLYGSGRGVAKFLSDMLSDKPVIFNKKTKDLFFTEQKINSGEALAMTLGWRSGKIEGVRYYEKAGGGPGGHSNIRIYPANNMATIYMINKTQVEENLISEFSTKLDKFFLNTKKVSNVK